MPSYRVTWEIDIEADNPTEAAARALIIQRDNDPANSATVFDVVEACGHSHRIDLHPDADDEPETCRTDGCDGDPSDGEGWDGYCGNCADVRDPVEA